MPKLIKWHGPLADPGTSTQQTPNDEKRILSFIAEFDEPVDEDFIYGQQPCPTYFESYTFNGRTNSRLFVVDRQTQQMPDSPQAYLVRITYSNTWTSQQMDGKFKWINNPLLRPALVSWGRYTDREAFELAYKEDGNSNEKTEMVSTTAGEPLILEEPVNYRAMSIEKNVRMVTDKFAEGEDFINIDPVSIGGHVFKPKCLWLLPIEIGHLSFENGFYFFPIVLTIMHNPNTWIRRIRNAGYHMRSLNPVYGKDIGQTLATPFYPIEPILDTNGRKLDRPVLLDDEGRPLNLVITGESPNPQWTPQLANSANPPPKTIKSYGVKAPDEAVPYTKEQLEKSVRYFRTRKYINFTREFGNVLK